VEDDMETSDKKRFLKRTGCLDDIQMDRVESFVFGMEEQRKRLLGSKRIRRPLKQDRKNMILAEDLP
jgi:hypothetical protein